MQDVLNNSKYKKNIIVCGDWNGHIGTDRLNYEGIIERHGVGNRNEDWKRILDFAIVNSVSVMNAFFQHLLTNNKSLFNDVRAVP